MTIQPPQSNPTDLLEKQLQTLTELYRLQKKQQEEQRLLLEKLEVSSRHLHSEVTVIGGLLSAIKDKPPIESIKISDLNISFRALVNLLFKGVFAWLVVMILFIPIMAILWFILLSIVRPFS